ncbi:alpha/beta fold hydrolase [Embleya sp. NBC_00896]|uniref:alpha/beta fold hydrolase n=1 Tax=Embleya sp. NBC_00896 TaxID=2975961 RepID=UPI002F90AB3A|nr:alpha/beta hydrolase [Embleya sp. NBC_00896]
MPPTIPSNDHAVPHVSTVPANKDEAVKLFVREYDGTKPHQPRKAVLMLHGRSVPALAGFDLRHGKYSWAQDLADAGYDVFIMDLQGSGRSPRPKMDEPCNANPAQQQDLLVPNPLPAPCPSPVYKSQLGNSQSDWDELNTVVEYIRTLRDVSKVALVGWSAAAFQIGPYALQHPEKVASLLFLAPIFPPEGRASAPAALPVSTPPAVFGFPMNLGSKAGFEEAWGREQHCPKQRETGMVDVVWKAIMENDSIGRGWGPKESGVAQGLVRIRNSYWWGWNSTTVPQDGTLGGTVPVLIVYGDLDTQANTPVSSGPLLHFSVPALYDAIPGPNKLMFRIACAGHSMVWERQSKVLHRMSRQWLKHTAVEGLAKGSFFVDEDGVYMPTE